MSRFVGAAAVAAVVIVAGARGALAGELSNSTAVVSPINNSTQKLAEPLPIVRPTQAPPTVPLPGAAVAGIVMMGGLLVGRRLLRRRRVVG